jgi:hypothetical protein
MPHIMSQLPIDYASHLARRRPTAVLVLGILGIVFGALGVLCTGFGLVASIAAMTNPHLRINGGAAQSPAVWQVALGFAGIILSGVLLFASIGALSLKPLARKVLIGLAVVDIAFGLIRLALTIFIVLPRVSQTLAAQQNVNTPQVAMAVKTVTMISAGLTWLIPTIFNVLLLIFFNRPEVVAAFETPPTAPGFPPPPIVV